MAYNYKFITDENYVEKQDDLNKKLLKSDYGADDLTEEEIELMLFTIRIEKEDYEYFFKWELLIDYIKYFINFELWNDIEGENADSIIEWAELLKTLYNK